MSRTRELLLSAAELRAEFDGVFTRPAAIAPAAEIDLLIVLLGERRYALRLRDVAAVHSGKRIVRAPTPNPLLLGLVGLRGNVVPAYDLALAFGHAPTSSARWLFELASPKPCAVAFAELSEHLRLPTSQLSPASAVSSTPEQRLLAGSASTAVGAVPIIDSTALYAELTGQGALPPREKEGAT